MTRRSIRSEIIAIGHCSTTPVTKAMAAIQKEFVDYNELRVAPEKDILECVGKEHPQCRSKVVVLHSVLNGVYERSNCLSAEYMTEMSKREMTSATQPEK